MLNLNLSKKIFIALLPLLALNNTNLKASLRDNFKKDQKEMFYNCGRLGRAMWNLSKMTPDEKDFLDNFLDEKIKNYQAKNKTPNTKTSQLAQQETSSSKKCFSKKKLIKTFYPAIRQIIGEHNSRKSHNIRIYKDLFNFLEKNLRKECFKFIFAAALSEKWTLDKDLPYITIPLKPFYKAFDRNTTTEKKNLSRCIRNYFNEQFKLYPIKHKNFSKHKENLKTLFGVNKISERKLRSQFLILTNREHQ